MTSEEFDQEINPVLAPEEPGATGSPDDPQQPATPPSPDTKEESETSSKDKDDDDDDEHDDDNRLPPPLASTIDVLQVIGAILIILSIPCCWAYCLFTRCLKRRPDPMGGQG